MKEYHDRLILGKGSSFVKSHLSRLPRTDEVWEADIQPISVWGWDSRQHGDLWLGMVLSHYGDFHLAVLTLTEPPTVNDLAKLLAKAMERPWIEVARRPSQVLLRGDPKWRELIPHLKQLKIEVEAQGDLPLWDAAAAEYVGRLRASRIGREVPVLAVRPGLDEAFPAVARWVRTRGRIEIEGDEGGGIVARAVDRDEGRVVFEDRDSKDVDEAMIALERWLGDSSL
jgi:hypothetical protein